MDDMIDVEITEVGSIVENWVQPVAQHRNPSEAQKKSMIVEMSINILKDMAIIFDTNIASIFTTGEMNAATAYRDEQYASIIDYTTYSPKEFVSNDLKSAFAKIGIRYGINDLGWLSQNYIDRVNLVTELFSQADVDFNTDLSTQDKTILNEFMRENKIAPISGDYGVMPEGRSVYDCLNLDHSLNGFKIVVNAHTSSRATEYNEMFDEFVKTGV